MKSCSFIIAAEQKARAAYERLMNITNDRSVIEPLALLREREIVHFQRFGEALMQLQNMCMKEYARG